MGHHFASRQIRQRDQHIVASVELDNPGWHVEDSPRQGRRCRPCHPTNLPSRGSAWLAGDACNHFICHRRNALSANVGRVLYLPYESISQALLQRAQHELVYSFRGLAVKARQEGKWQAMDFPRSKPRLKNHWLLENWKNDARHLDGVIHGRLLCICLRLRSRMPKVEVAR
jgi:hypothetical protein